MTDKQNRGVGDDEFPLDLASARKLLELFSIIRGLEIGLDCQRASGSLS